MTDQEILQRFNSHRQPANATLGTEVVAVDAAEGKVTLRCTATRDHCHSIEWSPKGGIVQAQLEDAQDDLAAARQRVSLVPVSVAISADSAIAKEDKDEDSGWSVSDALHDAGDVLTVMAGIALVSLAVLVPLALVGLLVFWGVTRLRRHQREAVLD